MRPTAQPAASSAMRGSCRGDARQPRSGRSKQRLTVRGAPGPRRTASMLTERTLIRCRRRQRLRRGRSHPSDVRAKFQIRTGPCRRGCRLVRRRHHGDLAHAHRHRHRQGAVPVGYALLEAGRPDPDEQLYCRPSLHRDWRTGGASSSFDFGEIGDWPSARALPDIDNLATTGRHQRRTGWDAPRAKAGPQRPLHRRTPTAKRASESAPRAKLLEAQ